MDKLGLWYVRWDKSSNAYYSRLKTLNKSPATVEDFKSRFDIAIVTTLEGFDAKYTHNGYADGRDLAIFVKSELGTKIEYYISLPYYPYDPTHEDKNGRGNINTGDYWFDWIDGVLSVDSNSLIGFYWDLEYAWMFKDYQKGKKESTIKPEVLSKIAAYIHEKGLKFIWIPSAHTYALQNTDIPSPTAMRSFDYIFVQSNYYMNSAERYPVTFSQFCDWLSALKRIGSGKTHIVLEADECVLGGHGNCRCCGNQKCCLTLASDYYFVQQKVLGRLDNPVVYYFGATLDVVDKVFDYYLTRMGVV
ncbi:DUF4855 domain-containing protein [Thermococcus sp. 21S7]|nr:DUF4855 domain-containing protein [Thermococcus sp. 21S7]NJE61281.1 DUF4855 domain-containing protein [Thermococcus sp. 21S7]